MTLLKNVIIDTTSIDKNRGLVALNWSVAQGCGLTNVQIIMPNDSTGHVGISLDGGSTIAVTDVVSSHSDAPPMLLRCSVLPRLFPELVSAFQMAPYLTGALCMSFLPSHLIYTLSSILLNHISPGDPQCKHR
jgi:hypothetical protein